ncbi:MAG: tRNA lysidine(34) synthetase TilS [Bacteroidales bacterium]|nr:tRNA lysidine(34) synthetase TilS [Bacteroidales bacterium]
MLTEFNRFIEKHNLINKGDKVLLALSGGVDSMVLAKLLIMSQRVSESTRLQAETQSHCQSQSQSHCQSHCHLAFAHCNFHLRGEDSNRDEKFVTDFARENKIPIFVKHFDTEAYAKENSLSIEMAARELRYNWFKELKEIHNFDKVALAHHGDDQIETFFINMLRGSGIKGLKGMKPQNDFYIRPLLFSNRNQIVTFAEENDIQWVEDYTNQETVYLRNKIRHQIIPSFDEIKHNARQSLNFSIDCLSSENELYRSLIEEKLSHIENVKGNYRFIENRHFLNNKNGRQLLFEWVRKYGFNYEQASSMYDAMRNEKSGVVFYSNANSQHSTANSIIASVQKEHVEIFEDMVGEEEHVIELQHLSNSETWRLGDLATWRLNISVIDKDENFKLIKDASTAQFDMDKIKFPLKLRHWKKGDKFKPLGMRGSKLLSDFFNDLGFTTYQKHNVWIMEDANDLILWVVGYRINDKVKILDSTRVIFQCDIKAQ